MQAMDHAPVILRPALIDDAQSIAKVHVASWRTTYPGIVPQPYIDSLNEEEFAQRWHTRLTEEPDLCIRVAEQDGLLCGFASGGPCRQTIAGLSAELYAIYLLTFAQHRGIGALLFWSVVQNLVASGHKSMYVWVLRQNPSRHFYERMGATPVMESTVEIGGQLLDETAYGWPDVNAALRKHAPNLLNL